LISKAKQLGKNSVIYAVGNALSRSMGLIALPIFTRLFSPGEYAFIDMIAVVNGLLAALFNLGLDLAQGIYFNEEKKKGQHAQRKLIASIFQIRLIWGVSVVLLCTLCFPIFNHFFFDNRLPWQYLALTFTASLFMQITAQSADLFRLLFRPWLSSLITIAQASGSMLIAVIIVLTFNVGVFGVIVGTFIGSLGSAVWGWWMARKYLDFSSLNRDWWPRLFRFGLPAIPLGLAGWLSMSLDRILIMNVLGPEAMGVYAVGVKIALIMVLITGALRMAWLPIAFDAIQTDEGKQLVRNVSCAYIGIGFSLAIIFTFFAPTLIQIISTPKYFEGHLVVGILSLYFVFDGYLWVSQLGLLKNKKTYLLTIFAVVGALTSIAVIYLLTPVLGIIGASIGMLVGVILRNILSLVVSETYYHVNFMSRILFLQFVLTMVTILNLLIHGSNTYSFLFSLISISLIFVQTYQHSEVFRYIFVRN
jgi:O-antigen/teichoic acid export membrane protein